MLAMVLRMKMRNFGGGLLRTTPRKTKERGSQKQTIRRTQTRRESDDIGLSDPFDEKEGSEQKKSLLPVHRVRQKTKERKKLKTMHKKTWRRTSLKAQRPQLRILTNALLNNRRKLPRRV